MTTTYPRECARCGRGKPPWFKYCQRCNVVVQKEQLEQNTCNEQDCSEIIDEGHHLCRTHWMQHRSGDLSECPECGDYKLSKYPLCRRCNTQMPNSARSLSQDGHSHEDVPQPRISNGRRSYDRYDGANDPKAKDKRFWFDRQDNGVCNYCGHRYPYDQLEMEHMIPKELGGEDHQRNMQLTCKPCNRKKGTSTDQEFRRRNTHLIPRKERKPPKKPIDPQWLKSGTRGARYRTRTRRGG